MTALVAWADAENAFLLADSSATHARKPKHLYSSFREYQLADHATVEESACKLLRLPQSVAVGLVGDAERGFGFAQVLRDALANGTTDLEALLEELHPDFESPADEAAFQVVVAQARPGGPVLFAYDSSAGSIAWSTTATTNTIWVLGSLPAETKQLVANVLAPLRARNYPADVTLMCALTFLQSLGVDAFLPKHSVCGAFFGLRLDLAHVHWQDEVCYLIPPPGMFAGAEVQADGQPSAASIAAAAVSFDKVRCLVVDDACVTVTSVAAPHVRAFIPLTALLGPSIRTRDEWIAAFREAGLGVGAAVETLSACRFYGVLRMQGARTALVVRRAKSLTGSHLSLTRAGELARIELSDSLVRAVDDADGPPHNVLFEV